MNRPKGIDIIENGVAVIIMMIVTPFLFACCSPKIEIETGSVTDRRIPELQVDSITTIISDSGIIRYRIHAATWTVYDKVDTPYWDFPQGLRFERFDTKYNIDAEIESDKALYYTKPEIWRLNGNVEAMNLNGEKFITQELYWDQKNEKVYSDSAITIIQKDQKINGIGFTSNQTFTRYSIKKPTGMFPIEETSK